MKTKYAVIAQAETIYNRDNVAFFGYPEQSGSWYIFRREFETHTDAARFLSDRIHDNFVNGITDLNTYGEQTFELYDNDRVIYNGVACNIVEIYIEE